MFLALSLRFISIFFDFSFTCWLFLLLVQVPHRGRAGLHVSTAMLNQAVNAALDRLTKNMGAGWDTIHNSTIV